MNTTTFSTFIIDGKIKNRTSLRKIDGEERTVCTLSFDFGISEITLHFRDIEAFKVFCERHNFQYEDEKVSVVCGACADK